MENSKITHLIGGILLAAVILGGNYFIIDFKVKDIVLENEYNKVGGKENFDFMIKSQADQLTAYREQYGDSAPTVPNAGNDNNQVEEKKEVQILDNTSKIKEDTYILGNPDAEVTFVEYSDLECPFCKKLHSNGTISQILEDYDGKVNFIFKHFPLDFHKMAQMEAEALECVGELAGTETYYSFIEEVFQNSATNGESYTKETISDLAGKMGVNRDEVLSCIESGKYTEKVKTQTAEGASLGVTGTPGNVLINNETGEYELLPGAYPLENFKKIIDGFLN